MENKLPSTEENIENVFSLRELDVLREIEARGIKPIAPILSSQMFELFLEGYSCLEISKRNKGLSEGDVLFCRKKFRWDFQRDQYAIDLQNQIREKLAKQKLESVEHLTNILAINHKKFRESMLKYMQTGNLEDFPKELSISGMGGYKSVIETLQKVTGEDRKQEIKKEMNVTINDTTKPILEITEEMHTKLLKEIIKTNE